MKQQKKNENPVKNPQDVIVAENISYSYGNNKILEKLSFKIKSGEYLGVIGPNGAGKTTLLKIILGLIKPTSGKINIISKNIGYVPQKAAQTEMQFPATVEEIVLSGRINSKGFFQIYKKADYEEAHKAMKTVGISHLKDRLINRLSGGERQKVFIARALSCEPEILILDEPTVAIDVASQDSFYNLLKKLNETLGLTIMIVSHDIDVVAQEVKSVLCLNRGLVCHGTPADILMDKNLEKIYGQKVKFILHGH